MKRVQRSLGLGLIPAGKILHVKLIERPHFKMRFYPRHGVSGLAVTPFITGQKVSVFGKAVAWWYE